MVLPLPAGPGSSAASSGDQTPMHPDWGYQPPSPAQKQQSPLDLANTISCQSSRCTVFTIMEETIAQLQPRRQQGPLALGTARVSIPANPLLPLPSPLVKFTRNIPAPGQRYKPQGALRSAINSIMTHLYPLIHYAAPAIGTGSQGTGNSK